MSHDLCFMFPNNGDNQNHVEIVYILPMKGHKDEKQLIFSTNQEKLLSIKARYPACDYRLYRLRNVFQNMLVDMYDIVYDASCLMTRELLLGLIASLEEDAELYPDSTKQGLKLDEGV